MSACCMISSTWTEKWYTNYADREKFTPILFLTAVRFFVLLSFRVMS